MRWSAIGLTIFALCGMALAENPFVSLIPNAETVVANDPAVANACQVCHTSTSGGALNAFGTQVQAKMVGTTLSWREISQLDADQDGYTNGAELGDPSGTWTVGQQNPGLASAITHPAKANSKPSSIRDQVSPTTWAVIKDMFR